MAISVQAKCGIDQCKTCIDRRGGARGNKRAGLAGAFAPASLSATRTACAARGSHFTRGSLFTIPGLLSQASLRTVPFEAIMSCGGHQGAVGVAVTWVGGRVRGAGCRAHRMADPWAPLRSHKSFRPTWLPRHAACRTGSRAARRPGSPPGTLPARARPLHPGGEAGIPSLDPRIRFARLPDGYQRRATPVPERVLRRRACPTRPIPTRPRF